MRRSFANLALVMFACAWLVAMPVTARAGLLEPHPHALLQVAIDGSDGVLDHHRLAGGVAGDRPAGDDHEHDHHVVRRVDPFALEAHVPTGDPPEHDRVGPVDGLSLVSAVEGSLWSLLVVLGATWSCAVVLRSDRELAWPVRRAPGGLAPHPLPPPPRPLPAGVPTV